MCGSEGPVGYPEPAEFARDVEDPAKPRFDIEKGKDAVDGLITTLVDKFTEAQKSSWARFWERYPKSVSDIPNDRLYPVRSMAFPPCAMRQLNDLRMRNHQVCSYKMLIALTIRYSRILL